MNESNKPSSSVQIKAKSDPEALLNDLSASLKSFQSTVRTWTASSTLRLNNTAHPADMGAMRQARLGLGAKPQRQAVAGDSVAANIALKNQLTGKSNTHQNSKNKNNYHQPTFTNSKVTKATAKKRGGSDDDDGGRDSLIKSRNKK